MGKRLSGETQQRSTRRHLVFGPKGNSRSFHATHCTERGFDLKKVHSLPSDLDLANATSTSVAEVGQAFDERHREEEPPIDGQEHQENET